MVIVPCSGKLVALLTSGDVCALHGTKLGDSAVGRCWHAPQIAPALASINRYTDKLDDAHGGIYIQKSISFKTAAPQFLNNRPISFMEAK